MTSRIKIEARHQRHRTRAFVHGITAIRFVTAVIGVGLITSAGKSDSGSATRSGGSDKEVALYLPATLQRATGMGEVTRGHDRATRCLQRGCSTRDGRSRIDMIKGNGTCKRKCPRATQAPIVGSKLHRTTVVIKSAAGLRKHGAARLRRANRGDTARRGKSPCGQRKSTHRQGGGTRGGSNTASGIHRQIRGNAP